MVVGRINMNKLNVIYEDNHIIVVEKQPNIPSQADKTEDIDMLTIIKEYIKEKYNFNLYTIFFKVEWTFFKNK